MFNEKANLFNNAELVVFFKKEISGEKLNALTSELRVSLLKACIDNLPVFKAARTHSYFYKIADIESADFKIKDDRAAREHKVLIGDATPKDKFAKIKSKVKIHETYPNARENLFSGLYKITIEANGTPLQSVNWGEVQGVLKHYELHAFVIFNNDAFIWDYYNKRSPLKAINERLECDAHTHFLDIRRLVSSKEAAEHTHKWLFDDEYKAKFVEKVNKNEAE